MTNTNLKGKRIVVAMKSVEPHLQESELGGSVASDNSIINKNTKNKNNKVVEWFILNNKRKAMDEGSWRLSPT